MTSQPVSGRVNLGGSQPAGGKSSGGGGASAGIYYPFLSADSTQGASAASYTTSDDGLDGVRLKKSEASLVARIGGSQVLGWDFADSDVYGPYNSQINNSGVTSGTPTADPYGGAGDLLQLTRASTHYLSLESPVFGGGGKGTLAGWVYPTTVGVDQTIWQSQFGGAAGRHACYFYISSANALAAFNQNDWYSDAGNVTSSGGTMTVNTWQYVAWTFDIANTRQSVYRGLTPGGTATRVDQDTIAGEHAATMLHIGGDAGGALYFDGYMHDMRAYSDELGAGAATLAIPSAAPTVFPTGNAISFTDRTVDLSSTVEIDMTSVVFHWAAGSSGTTDVEVELALKAADSWAVGDFTAGNMFEDPLLGGTAHANPTGRYLRIGFRSNSGADTLPARLLGISFDLV